LGAIPYRPGVGGAQNVEKPKSNRLIYLVTYEQWVMKKPCHLLVTLLNVIARKVIGKINAVIEGKVV
jgi:hypothetical protein